MLKIDPEGTNELRIKTVKTMADSIKTVPCEYYCNNVFQGIGCLWENNTGKKIEVKLEMETDAKPVLRNHALYHITYRNHCAISLTDWPDQGVKEETFEKVPDGEAIICSGIHHQWFNPN